MTSRRVPAGAFLLVTAGALVVAALASLAWGPEPLRYSLGGVAAALAQGLGLHEGVERTQLVVVNAVRMPRLLIGVFAGAGLALAGTAMQALFRNPLASPEIVGTTAGSALGGALAIVLGFASASHLVVPAYAFGGAFVVSALVWGAAAGPGGVSVTALLLAGIAMNSLVGALTSFVVTLSYGDWTRSGEILFWLLGGLENTTMPQALLAGAGIAVLGALLWPFARDMDLLTLDEAGALTLGVNVSGLRRVLLLLACGITGFAVAFTGAIAFVGLVVPHMVRLCVGPSHRALLPCAAALGALTLVAADLFCRVVVPDGSVRIGVVTSALGAPFFLWLLARHRRGERL